MRRYSLSQAIWIAFSVVALFASSPAVAGQDDGQNGALNCTVENAGVLLSWNIFFFAPIKGTYRNSRPARSPAELYFPLRKLLFGGLTAGRSSSLPVMLSLGVEDVVTESTSQLLPPRSRRTAPAEYLWAAALTLSPSKNRPADPDSLARHSTHQEQSLE
jgi:hypothetical protein